MTDNRPSEWEYFCDRAYFDNWAVKDKSNGNFADAFHVTSEAEAKSLCAKLNELSRVNGELDSLNQLLDSTNQTNQAMGRKLKELETELASTKAELEAMKANKYNLLEQLDQLSVQNHRHLREISSLMVDKAELKSALSTQATPLGQKE